MTDKQMMILVGLGVGYFFLKNRQPVFVKMADGSYQPAGILDQFTVAITGQVPPPTQPVNNSNVSLTLPGGVGISYTN